MAYPSAQTKSRSVLGATELTLLAPIKRGLIPALDTRSYRSRARLVLDTLHALGVSRREVEPTPAIAEVAQSIQAIRSFRMAIVGDEQPQVLLSVSFDGGWEPYMRRIWSPLGPLLDLVFCNCEGYLLSTEHGFREYISWVRKAQVETGFYYEDSPLTVADLALLEQQQGRPTPAPAPAVGTMQEQARPAMVALYRLSDMFPDRPGVADGVVLRRAARLLLGELAAVNTPAPGLLRTPTEEAAWRWFQQPVPARRQGQAAGTEDLANVQAGILEPHEGISFGRLVLVGLDDAAGVVGLLDHLQQHQPVTPAAPPFKRSGPMFVNIAFTHAGLLLAGVDPGTLGQLPQEFREGMEARASILGDREHNHPRHWKLPARHNGTDRVQLSTVHAVVQFWHVDDAGALAAAVSGLGVALQGCGGRLLAVEEMQRIRKGQNVVGHFGFADGLSDPRFTAKPGAGELPLGEVLLGHGNQRLDTAQEGPLWTDSSFLVVRKLRQDVEAFRQLPAAATARLMGRNADGTALVPGANGNNFDFSKDPHGAACPLHAHIRRANPRSTRPNELDHLPRIARRGMSYGPPFGQAPNEERGLMFLAYNASIAEQFELVQGWLAGANSSGPGSYSGLRDPFLGVPRAGDPRRYDLGNGQQVDLPATPLVTLEWGLYALAPSLRALKELRRWAAERAEEDRIQDVDKADVSEAARRRKDRRDREQAAQAGLGSALIARLMRVEQVLGFDAAVQEWKLALEDLGARMSGVAQAIWTAVRHAHGGALRTPYGVLVGSKALVDQVFTNQQGDFTVSGYNTRLGKSFGEIYLGRDDGTPYRDEAQPANQAIMGVTKAAAFQLAEQFTTQALANWITGLPPGQDITLDMRDLIDEVLADLSRHWFGLPDGALVQRGGWHWQDTVATCPGHFHSPSRYTFQPHPGEQARDVGEAHGQLLKQQVLLFIQAKRSQPAQQGTLGQQLFAAFPDDQRLASTLIGAMMGFLPTVDGNLRGVLYEWVNDRSLWDHQGAFHRSTATGLSRAEAVIEPALSKSMHLRPVPEVVWRTALRDCALGPVNVRTGDTLVVSIVSAMQGELLNERRCLSVVFGGGIRSQAVGNKPTHACPGYEMAMGVMLGLLSGLLERPNLKPAASPLMLTIGTP